MFILLKEMGPWSVGGVDRASSPDALGSEFETHSVRKYHFFNIPRRAQRQISELSEGGRVNQKNMLLKRLDEISTCIHPWP